MTYVTSNVCKRTYYSENSEVSFVIDSRNTLAVTIDTDRLHMRSVSEEDSSYYAALFGDPEVMGKYATGETYDKEAIETRIKKIWVKRWQEKDPYSGLAVFKNDTKEFIGHVIVGHGDQPGQSELAYLFMKNHWGKRYGTEAVTAIVKDYAPATIEEGYTLEGKILEEVTATARADNLASVRILERLKMSNIGMEIKHDALRYHFSMNLKDLTN